MLWRGCLVVKCHQLADGGDGFGCENLVLFDTRRFALAFVSQDDLLSFEVDQGVCEPECPPWYRAKLYFEALHAKNETGQPERHPDVPMANFIEPVKKLLSTRYAAVGILEEWDESMALFDHALELPRSSWSRLSSHTRSKNQVKPRFSAEKDELQRTAWTDQKLIKSLSLDLILYEHAVGVHQRQMRDYGLMK